MLVHNKYSNILSFFSYFKNPTGIFSSILAIYMKCSLALLLLWKQNKNKFSFTRVLCEGFEFF